ncbi:MAG: peroxiredoxin family protein [Fimbriimonadales bacterium]|nr:peroxiredoxin family protein [Fimbriimonadales bacterium]
MSARKMLWVAAGVLLAVLVLRSGAGGGPKPGEPARGFTAATSAGRTVSLDGLLQKGPVVLYFIKADCPVNADAVAHYSKIAARYGDGKGTFLGVINGDERIYRQWQREFQAPFEVAYDPDMKIISSYGAQRSPWIVALDASGKVALTQAGFSQKELADLNRHVAQAFGKPFAEISFPGAPSAPRYG